MAKVNKSFQIFRSVAAVFAGLVAMVILSTVTDFALENTVFPELAKPSAPTHLWLLATVYRAIYFVAGGLVAAYLAPKSPMAHAMALGFILLILQIVGAVAIAPSGVPQWFLWTLVALTLPCAWIGGKFYEMRWRPLPA
jgi:hypothetical protein